MDQFIIQKHEMSNSCKPLDSIHSFTVLKDTLVIICRTEPTTPKTGTCNNGRLLLAYII